MLLPPVAELAVAIEVGQWIGAWPTIGLLVLLSAIGVVVVRARGTVAWRSLNESVQAGKPPSPQLATAATQVVAGILLIIPGFLTDVVALLLFLPVTRSLVRRPLERRFRRAAEQRVTVLRTFPPGFGFGGPGDYRGTEVVEGEIIEDEPPAR